MTDINILIGVDVCCYDMPYSNCYTQDWSCGAYWVSWVPDPFGYGMDYVNTRFTTDGADTLIEVGVALYPAWSVGDPDVEIYVWGSSGGNPDLTDVIYQTTVPYGSWGWYTSVAMPGGGIVLPPASDFHVGWSAIPNSPDDSVCYLMDFGDCGQLRSGMYLGIISDWYLSADFWSSGDCNWIMYADLCKDEFELCDRIVNYCDPYWIYSMPSSSGSGRVAGYEKIEPFGIGCRLEEVRVKTLDPYWIGWPAGYQYTADLEIREDNGGLPGALIVSQTIGPGTGIPYVDDPGFNTWDVSALNIYTDEVFWVGIKSNAPDPPSGYTDFFLVGDNDECGGENAAVWYTDGTYVPYWGSNFHIDAYICCIPPPERPCVPELAPDPNWPTCGHDFRRSSASDNPTPNARCTQSLLWTTNNAAGFLYNRPIIYDNILLASFGTSLQAFDINTGPPALWAVTAIPYMSSNHANTVTVQDGYVYYGGGNAASFVKADITAPSPPAWARTVITDPPAGLSGVSDYTSSVILDCDGTEVIFFTTSDALYAVKTSDGQNYTGWSVNPMVLEGHPYSTLSSNGVDKLYIGHGGQYTDAEGSIICIDACTGEIDWELTYPDLAGDELVFDPPWEWFRGPLAVDADGSIYANTACDNFYPGTDPGVPNGVHYKFDPNGNIVWAKGGYYSYWSGVVIDANAVYVKSWRGWTSDPLNTLMSRKKFNGSMLWMSDPFFSSLGLVEGALSCEPLERDLLYTTNNQAQMLVLDAETGLSEFEYNYVGITSNQGCGVAIDPEHVVMTTRQGDIFVFTQGAKADRPRLRILKFDELQPVPFFSPVNHPVTFEDVFMNNGCTDLTGTLTANETPVNPSAVVWSVDPDRIQRLQDAAMSMVDNSFQSLASNLVKGEYTADNIDELNESPYISGGSSNMAAYLPPAWLNAITNPNFTVSEGQTYDVIYDVNGPLVTRGPHYCYVQITSNDTEYYLNAQYGPEVQLGVLGGCLQEDDVIHFGVGGANSGPVFNTGEIGNQSGAAHWDFDGDDAAYWQGGLFFATDQYELAWTTDSWHGGDPDNFWASLLPDPNCFGQCEPYVTPDPIVLGAYWDDVSMAYVDIEGYVSAAAYVDSVIDFDCYGSGWSWDNVACPFDNDLTIGIRVDEYMYGAIDYAPLNNVVIYRHDITNRNADPITGMGMSAFHDYDLESNGYDVWKYSDAFGIAYGASCDPLLDMGNTKVYGTGTIPMDIMRNAHTVDAQQAMWEADYVWLDSCYYYMANVTGQTGQPGVVHSWPCTQDDDSDDRDLWATFWLGDMGGSATMSIGTYFFGYPHGDVNDDQFYYDLATLINQFAGFDRGDICGVEGIDLADVVHLLNMVLGISDACPPPPFYHMADVDDNGVVDMADYEYLKAYYFCAGPPPAGGWALPYICP
jgi:hypothetical protein